ncbi:uncharacterized protein J3R85_016161 [Psidium guajava]|nr:uncharacterized protein J3R85_016161 [Psidium guajava]
MHEGGRPRVLVLVGASGTMRRRELGIPFAGRGTEPDWILSGPHPKP